MAEVVTPALRKIKVPSRYQNDGTNEYHICGLAPQETKHEMPRMNRGASPWEVVSLRCHARGRALAIIVAHIALWCLFLKLETTTWGSMNSRFDANNDLPTANGYTIDVKRTCLWNLNANYLLMTELDADEIDRMDGNKSLRLVFRREI